MKPNLEVAVVGTSTMEPTYICTCAYCVWSEEVRIDILTYRDSNNWQDEAARIYIYKL